MSRCASWSYADCCEADPIAFQTEASLAEIKSQVKMILRKMNRNSAEQATLDSGPYTLQYVLETQSHQSRPE